MDEVLYHQMAATERDHWWFAGKRAVLRALIDRYVTREPGRRPRVADIGCGTGALLDELGHEYDVVGADGSETARELAAKRGLRVMDCRLPENLPLERASYDAVVMSDVLEHIDDDRGSAAAAAGLLRPGGIMVATVPAHPWMWTVHDETHHHKRRYRRREFEALFESAGLRREVLSFYNVALFPAMALSRLATRHLGVGGGAGGGLPPRPINGVLRAVFAAERAFLPHVASPVGGSLIAVYRAPSAGAGRTSTTMSLPSP
ncbi:MAG: class I SAM-dependent methyltransferase [Phycisphaerales bacterium]